MLYDGRKAFLCADRLLGAYCTLPAIFPFAFTVTVYSVFLKTKAPGDKASGAKRLQKWQVRADFSSGQANCGRNVTDKLNDGRLFRLLKRHDRLYDAMVFHFRHLDVQPAGFHRKGRAVLRDGA